MMARSTDRETAGAQKVWKLMFDYLMRSAPQRTQVLGRLGLTPNDSRALSTLDAKEGRTMRSLAEEWRCDASNATWIVDRLEKLALAERRGVTHDRRVKLVVLTRRGVRMKNAILREFLKPPGGLQDLGRADLESLQRILEKLR